MSRARALLLLAAGTAALAVVAGVLLEVRVRRSSASSSPSAGPSPIADRAGARAAPAWCGWPLGTKGGRARKDMSDCGKLSLTGSAPGCVFAAECSDAHVQIDCASAGEGWCRCDGRDGRLVRYDPAFCALDTDAPSRSMRAILDRGATACRWTTP